MNFAMTLVLMLGAFIAMSLAVTRLIRGPSQADRIVALDVVFSSNVALTAAISLATGRALFLDIGIGLAMVGFVATIVWSRLIDAGRNRRVDHDSAPPMDSMGDRSSR